MALRPDRTVLDSDISWFYQSGSTAERGGIVSIVTAGSGAAMDSSSQVCVYAAAGSGAKPLGLLANEVVNRDLTYTHENFLKDEVQTGTKCTVYSKGTFVTDMIMAGVTPAAGDPAYLGDAGKLRTADRGGDALVGEFVTKKNEEGFAKVSINLPQRK